MYVIGTDIGTGSTKAIAVSHDGTILGSAQVAYPTHHPGPGRSEQVPELIWQAFFTCLSRVISECAAEPSAICLSSAMHSLIPVDHSGTPLSNMMTWADNRSSDIAARLRHAPFGRGLYEQTGTPIHAMSPLCKIIWLKENQPDLYEHTARFISIKEFIWFRMFGVYEVDYSIASATGLFNINTLQWNEQSLELTGLTTDRLSVPVNTNLIRAEAGIRLSGLSGNIPVMIGASDGCLANIGSFATAPGTAALTIGTSGAIRVTTKTPALNWDQMTFNYRLNEKLFVSGGPINNGGIALKWYAEKLLGKALNTDLAYIDLLKPLDTIPPGAAGLIFLPYLFGERAPIWNSHACGVFFGITGQHTQEHFTRAIIEGILFSLNQIMRGIEKDGVTISQIHVSGGFVRSSSWVQMLSTILGKKVLLVNRDDASAIGAALMGLEALNAEGTYNEFDEAQTVTFLPDMMEHAYYNERVFPLYERLYRSLSMDMEILHEYKGG